MKDTIFPNTVGQFRIRSDFNVTEDDEKKEYVNSINKDSAALIDKIANAAPDKQFTDEQFNEFKRLQALAMTAYEQAAMWAVKLATL